MLCAISGEPPDVPVVSRKSGHIFEKRLIEVYIKQYGRDPVSKEELTTDDLLEVKTPRIVRPRPPTMTSIPSLLHAFQDEWDALTLEAFELKQELARTQQELSTALYLHDGALRVIARLTMERDEARTALARVAVAPSDATNEDAMQVDSHELPQEIIAKIEATQEQLSKTRRKRRISENWATEESIRTYSLASKCEALCPGCKTVSVNASGDLALVGGAGGTATIYSLTDQRAVQTLQSASGEILNTLWAGNKAVISTSSGNVQVFEDGKELSSFNSHAGAAVGLALHPCGDIIASIGVDKSYVLYDIVNFTVLTQVYTSAGLTSVRFHPDGHLIAAGATDGDIKIFDVKTSTNAANFAAAATPKALEFSENGIWLAVAVEGQSTISVWDLRKGIVVMTLENDGENEAMDWDYTGQFLAIVGPTGVTVKQYTRATKQWSEPLKIGLPGISIKWGQHAQRLITVDGDGSLSVLGPNN